MWLLNRFLRTPQKSLGEKGIENSKPLPLPPYDLLDRHFRLPDGSEIKVVGFQYAPLLRVPFVLRCRVIESGEVVLIDPDLLRRFATEITPFNPKREAFRRPYVPRSEETLRVIGWETRTNRDPKNRLVTDLVRIADQDRGEGVQ